MIDRNLGVRSPVVIFALLALLLGAGACVNVQVPVESHFNKGVDFYDQGSYAQAIEEYKLELRQHPDNTFAQYNLAVTYQDMGKDDRAEAIYKNILNRIEDTNSRINLSAIYRSRGHNDLAFEQLRTAADNNSEHAGPLSVLGEYRETDNQWNDARDFYRQALAIDDRHAMTHYRLGRLLLKQGKPEKAVESLLQAVELDGGVPLFMETLADAYKNRDKPFLAIDMLERVSVLEPDRQEIYVRLGNLYKKVKMYKEAVNRYWTAIEIKDDDPSLHRTLRDIFQRLEQHESEQLEEKERQGTLARSNERR